MSEVTCWHYAAKAYLGFVPDLPNEKTLQTFLTNLPKQKTCPESGPLVCRLCEYAISTYWAEGASHKKGKRNVPKAAYDDLSNCVHNPVAPSK